MYLARHRFPLRNQAAAADEGAAAAPAAAPAPAAPAASPAPAPAAGAPAAAPAPSALATAAPAAAAPKPLLERIPEALRVLNEDGTLNFEASLDKVADARAELDGKLGQVPASAKDYKLSVPESLKDWDTAADEPLQAFLAKAHETGMTQAQIDACMAAYFPVLEEMASRPVPLTGEECIAELRKAWPDEAAFKANMGHAYKAAVTFGEKVGIDFKDIEAAGLANNPVFSRLMAAIGPELGEDTPVGGGPGSLEGIDTQIAQLVEQRDKYGDNDPRRAPIVAQLKALYEKKHPEPR